MLLDFSLFFDTHLQFLKRIDEGKFWNMLLPYYSENFDVSKYQLESLGKKSGLEYRSIVDGGFRPLEINSIKSDSQLKILIREVIYMRSGRVGLYKNATLSGIENLIVGIDIEIARFQ